MTFNLPLGSLRHELFIVNLVTALTVLLAAGMTILGYKPLDLRNNCRTVDSVSGSHLVAVLR